MSVTIDQIKFDCRHFDSAKPCKPHKHYGVFCGDCRYYDRTHFSILIIKFAAVGDVLRTTSILPALKEKYPHSRITWITATGALPVFRNNPDVDLVLADAAHYLPMLATVEYDLLINLEADRHSSALAATVKAKQRAGYTLTPEGFVCPVNNDAVEWFLMGINDDLKKRNTKTYFKHIYSIAGLAVAPFAPRIYLTPDEKVKAAEFRQAHNLQKFSRVLGINTGSGGRWPLKKWTLQNHIALLERLHTEMPNVALLLFGGPDEVDYNRVLKEKLSFPVIDTGTSNSLREFFALLDLVDVLFTPDSLAMHAGNALQKQVIAYTGPTSFTELDMFGKGEVIHSTSMDCLVCYLNSCDKDPNCMTSLSVDAVFSTIAVNVAVKQ